MDASSTPVNSHNRSAGHSSRKVTIVTTDTRGSPLRSSSFCEPPEMPWERSPKTDYTYANSGSYNPQLIGKDYIVPNMSRPRIRDGRRITLGSATMPSPSHATTATTSHYTSYEQSGSFIQRSPDTDRRVTPDRDPQMINRSTSRSMTRSGLPYGKLWRKESKGRLRSRSNSRRDNLMQKYYEGTNESITAQQGTSQHDSQIEHLYGLDHSDGEIIDDEHDRRHTRLRQRHIPRQPTPQQRSILTTFIQIITTIVTTTTGPAARRQLWRGPVVAAQTVGLLGYYILYTIIYLITAPFVWAWLGVREWWASLDSSREVTVDGGIAGGADTVYGTDQFVTTTTTTTVTTTEEELLKQQRRKLADGGTQSGAAASLVSPSLWRQPWRWAGSLVHAIIEVISQALYVVFCVLTAPFVWSWQGLRDWWRSLEDSPSVEETEGTGRQWQPTGQSSSSGHGFDSEQRVTTTVTTTEEESVHSQHKDAVQAGPDTDGTRPWNAAAHSQQADNRARSWNDWGTALSSACSWTCQWLGVVFYTTIYITTGPVRWLCLAVSKLWHKLWERKSDRTYQVASSTEKTRNTDLTDTTEETITTTTETEVTEQLSKSGHRIGKRAGRRSRRLAVAGGDEVDSDSGYSDGGLDRESEIQEGTGESICRGLTWLCRPFLVLLSVMAAPFIWLMSMFNKPWVRESSVDTSHDPTSVAASSRRGERGVYNKKGTGESICRGLTWLCRPFLVLLSVMAAPFIWLMSMFNKPWVRESSVDTSHSPTSVAASSRRGERGVYNKGDAGSCCFKLVSFVCWPMKTLLRLLIGLPLMMWGLTDTLRSWKPFSSPQGPGAEGALAGGSARATANTASTAGKWWSAIQRAGSQAALADVWLLSRSSTRRRGCGWCCLPLILLIPMLLTGAYYVYDRGLLALPLVPVGNHTDKVQDAYIAGGVAPCGNCYDDAQLKLRVQQILMESMKDQETQQAAEQQRHWETYTQQWEAQARALILQLLSEQSSQQTGVTLEQVDERVLAAMEAQPTQMTDSIKMFVLSEIKNMAATLGGGGTDGTELEQLAMLLQKQAEHAARMIALQEQLDELSLKMEAQSSSLPVLPSDPSLSVELLEQVSERVVMLQSEQQAKVTDGLSSWQTATKEELVALVQQLVDQQMAELSQQLKTLQQAGHDEVAAQLQVQLQSHEAILRERVHEVATSQQDDLSGQLAAWQQAQQAQLSETLQTLQAASQDALHAYMSDWQLNTQKTLVGQLQTGQDELAANLASVVADYKKELQEMLQAMVKQELVVLAASEDSKQTDTPVTQVVVDSAHQAKLEALENKIGVLLADYKNISSQLSDAQLHVASDYGSSDTALLVAALESQLGELRSALEDLQGSHTGLLLKLGSCCKNDSALALLVQQQLDTLFGVSGGGMFGGGGASSGGGSLGAGPGSKTVDHGMHESAFMAWLQEQLQNRDVEIKELTMRFNEQLQAQEAHQRDSDRSTVVINQGGGGAALTEVQVRQLIREALLIFGADKTGQVDYALESAGGSVVSTRCSETYQRRTAEFSLFGIPLWYSANSPRTVIQPEMQPGQCWPFRGSEGYLVIKLVGLVKPTAFSLEHIPKSMSPTGQIDSAPKDFTVWGLDWEHDRVGVLLGNYTYQEDGEPLQYFPVRDPDVRAFEYAELRIHNNHGNVEYTCLYRFRVHGKLEDW